MAQKIVERVIGAETERRLAITNSQLARTMSIGSSWTRIRLGVRWSVEHTSYTIGTVGIFVGLTNGVSNVWASASCNHALGAYYNLATGGTATTGVGIGNGLFVKRVGTSNTTLNANYLMNVSTAGTITLTNLTTRNCVYVIEFAKKAGNIYSANVAGGAGSTTGTYASKTLEQVQDGMIQSSMANCATALGLSNAAGEREATAGAVDEGTDGALDSVCIYWRNPNYFLELSDVIVARIE